MTTTKELLAHIQLTTQDTENFEGENFSIGSPHVFGGQVLGQGLSAMHQSLTQQRVCHSLHAYFLLPGDLNTPIDYEVTKVRDGGSFSNRYVVAKQKGRTIFSMTASFQAKEEGYEHQASMPEVKRPEELMSWDDVYTQMKDVLPPSATSFLSIPRPVSIKPTVLYSPLAQEKKPPHQEVWIQFKESEGIVATKNEKRALLAYVSDYNILGTALHPHAEVAHFGNTQMATIDHSIWFHRDFDITDWLLVQLDSPSASGARGFAKGKIFDQKGRLIASIAQEGLMRPKK